MSSHPYRENVSGAAVSAPYPLEEPLSQNPPRNPSPPRNTSPARNRPLESTPLNYNMGQEPLRVPEKRNQKQSQKGQPRVPSDHEIPLSLQPSQQMLSQISHSPAPNTHQSQPNNHQQNQPYQNGHSLQNGHTLQNATPIHQNGQYQDFSPSPRIGSDHDHSGKSPEPAETPRVQPVGSTEFDSANESATSLPMPPPQTHSHSVSSTSSFFYDPKENFDLSHSNVSSYLSNNPASLVPRMKTIELYRKNAKKSNDPAVLFQYAQYMLQTALVVDANDANNGAFGSNSTLDSLSRSAGSQSPKSHQKSNSQSSLADSGSLADPNLKRSLLKEAHFYLKKLSDKGYSDAQYLLGDAYSSGVLGKVDNKEAFSLFLSAAKHGHTECAFRVAHCYEEGLGTGRDARKGIEFLKMAASKNHPAAMYKLGMYFFQAKMGVPDTLVNKRMGIKWLERASNVATELTSSAPYELGKIYYDGFADILIKDQTYALELYAQAAALGNVPAAAVLGQHYEMGNIVPEDANLSIHYYTKAALGGHPQSMLAMCAWYMVGADPYLPKDEREAFEWAKRAALCDHGKAQFVLANFYDKGIGCTVNFDESQKWYVKAAENGQEKALERIRDKDTAAKVAKKARKLRRTPSDNFRPQEKDCVIV